MDVSMFSVWYLHLKYIIKLILKNPINMYNAGQLIMKID